jgi:hypothetical protein
VKETPIPSPIRNIIFLISPFPSFTVAAVLVPKEVVNIRAKLITIINIHFTKNPIFHFPPDVVNAIYYG